MEPRCLRQIPRGDRDQTPQVFKFSELYGAYRQAGEDKFTGTDDATLFERYVGMVKVVEGDSANIKITTPDDLVVVRSLLQHRGALGQEAR